MLISLSIYKAGDPLPVNPPAFPVVILHQLERTYKEKEKEILRKIQEHRIDPDYQKELKADLAELKDKWQQLKALFELDKQRPRPRQTLHDAYHAFVLGHPHG